MKFLFVGGGNMGRALVGGLLAQGVAPDALTVLEIDAGARERIVREFAVAVAGEVSANVVGGADVLLLAVKPQSLRQTATLLAPHLTRQLVISIAAGIRLADLSRWLGNYERVVRAMPNTPAVSTLVLAVWP